MSGLLSRRGLLQQAALAMLSLPLACDRSPDRVDGRVSLRLWYSYGGKNRQVLEDLVARFNASQHEVRVRATFQGDYFEALAKLRTAIGANAAPTISHVVSEVVPYLAEAGVLEPMDTYPGADRLDLVTQLAQEGTYLGGEHKPLVALPFNRSTPIMYVNQTILAAEGVAPPTTWGELVAAARALTRRRQGGSARWGFECPISWWFWVALLEQEGGTVLGTDGTPWVGGEAGVRAIELWQDMVHRDRTMRPPPGRDYNAWEATNSDFLAERAAIIFSSTAFVRYLEENARFEVLAAPLPRGKRAAVPTGGTFFVMVRNAPEREKRAAWEFLRWMMQPTQTIRWATRTGYLPVARAATEQLEREGYYRDHPNDRVALDQLAVAQPWPWAKNLFRVQRECIDPLIEEAVLTRRSARDVLAEASRRATDV